MLLKPRRNRAVTGRAGATLHKAAVLPVVAVMLLTTAQAASASETMAWQMEHGPFPTKLVFLFLFLMLGPLKIVGPYTKITRGADAALARRIAFRATIYASLSLIVAALVGQLYYFGKFGIPVPVLGLTAGLILSLVALSDIIRKASPSHLATPDTGPIPPPPMSVALTLAFPTIITPYGIATLVVLLALSPTVEGRLMVGGLAAVIMVLNLSLMIVSRYLMPALALVLTILDAALGVVQVSLGLMIIQNSLRAMRLL